MQAFFEKIIKADIIIAYPNDPQDLNRYAYCRNNPINLVDPTGHSWLSKTFKKIGDFFKKSWEYVASAAIVVATSFAVIATGGTASIFMPALIGEVIGGITGGIAAYQAGGDLGRGIFAGTAIGGITAMAAIGFKDYMLNNVFANSIISPFQGGMITAAEFAIGGFGAGLIEGYAGGARGWSDAFRHAGISAGFGAALGFAAGYSYTAGWQSFLHGADTQRHNIRQKIRQFMIDLGKIALPPQAGAAMQALESMQIGQRLYNETISILEQKYGFGPMINEIISGGMSAQRFINENYRSEIWLRNRTSNAAVDGVNSTLNSNIEIADKYSKWQFRLIIIGAILFLIWHILEMILNTFAT